MAELKDAAGLQFGMVSAEIPLISNLDVLRNIALIYQYHRDVAKKKGLDFVRQCLQRYGLEKMAHKKTSELSDEERFCVMVLRAAMVEKAVIAIDRPFKMLHYHNDISFIYETLDKINDLFVRCDIFDYDQEKHKCELIHDSES